jgi:hypothetical protein
MTMKKLAPAVFFLVFLCGCGRNPNLSLPENDVGVIDVSRTNPIIHTLSDGRVCTITPFVTLDDNIQLRTFIVATNSFAAYSNIFRARMTDARLGFGVDTNTVLFLKLRASNGWPPEKLVKPGPTATSHSLSGPAIGLLGIYVRGTQYFARFWVSNYTMVPIAFTPAFVEIQQSDGGWASNSFFNSSGIRTANMPGTNLPLPPTKRLNSVLQKPSGTNSHARVIQFSGTNPLVVPPTGDWNVLRWRATWDGDLAEELPSGKGTTFSIPLLKTNSSWRIAFFVTQRTVMNVVKDSVRDFGKTNPYSTYRTYGGERFVIRTPEISLVPP